MRKYAYDKYSEKIALAICGKDPLAAWTILGHGTLGHSSKQGHQHVMDVIIAPLRTGKVAINEAITVQMPIGIVELLRLRCSWYKGQLSLENKRSNNVENRCVQLKTDSFYEQKLGDLWPINAVENKALEMLQGVKYLTYRAVHDGEIINLHVPCAEIFRFYYSASTNFALAALSGKVASEALYNPQNREVPAKKAAKLGVPCVTLRKSIEDITAPYVARFAVCSYAEKTFNEIFQRVFHDHRDNPGKYLICRPPLDQETSWDVDGIAYGKDFFVRQIKACYGAFPFKRVFFDRDNNTSGLRTQEPERTMKIVQSSPVLLDGDDTNNVAQIADHQAPSISVEPISFEVFEGNPVFPFLENISIEKVIKGFLLDEKTKTIRILSGEVLIKFVTTAAASGQIDNGYTGQISIFKGKPTDGCQSSQHHVAVSIHEVICVLDSMLREARLGYAECRYFQEKIHPKYGWLASIVPYHDYEDKGICFIKPKVDLENYFLNNKDPYYLRPMAYFHISYRGKIYYLIEFLGLDGLSHDGKATMFFSEFKSEANEELVKQEIRKYDKYGQNWKKSTIGTKPEPSSKLAHRFFHNPKSDIDQKVERIMKELKVCTQI